MPWDMQRLTWRELGEIEDYFAREQEPEKQGGADEFDVSRLPFTEEAG